MIKKIFSKNFFDAEKKYLPKKKQTEYIKIIREKGWKIKELYISPFNSIIRERVIPHAGQGNPVI